MNKNPNTEKEIIDALMNDAALLVSNGKGGLYRVRVTRDQEPLDPRVEMENLGVMYCSHRRYSLGDENLDEDTFEDLRQRKLADNDNEVILPLYLYDHGDLSISTQSFNDPWDSGFIGYIVATDEDWKRMQGKDAPWDKDKVKTYLEEEVETYNKYLQGDIFFVNCEKWQPSKFGQNPNIENDNEWEDFGLSCGGLFESDIYYIITDEIGNDLFILNDKKDFEEATKDVFDKLKNETISVDCSICNGKHTISLFVVNGRREGVCEKCGCQVRINADFPLNGGH